MDLLHILNSCISSERGVWLFGRHPVHDRQENILLSYFPTALMCLKPSFDPSSCKQVLPSASTCWLFLKSDAEPKFG